MGAGLQNTIVFCNAVTAVAMCAASKGKAAGQVCGRGLYSTADNIQLYRHGESGARYSAQTAAVSSSLYRHKAGERTTAGERGGIYSSAQEQEHKAAIFVFTISLQDCQPPTRHPHPRFWRWCENEALSKGRGHFISTFFSTLIKKFRSK